MSGSLSISIAILSHNRLDELSKNLPKLLSNRKAKNKIEIIVADNNSSDGSRDYLVKLKESYPDLILVLNDENKGVGGGRNSGWEVATGDIIVALDDDSFIQHEDIKKIPDIFQVNPNIGIVAFKIVHPITKELQNPHGDSQCEVANHHGAGFAFLRSTYEKIGGIDSSIIYGADELDFAIKVHSLGLKISYNPTILVHHNSMIRERKIEITRDNGYLFNNIRLYYKYFPKRMARRNSFRYAFTSSIYWLKTYGAKGIWHFFKTIKLAVRVGISQHVTLPIDTIKYYNNSSLRPEFGNVPIYLKLVKLLRK